MEKKSLAKKMMLVAGLAAGIIGLNTIFSEAQATGSTGKNIVASNKTDKKGNITCYGNTCELGNNTCTANPCQ